MVELLLALIIAGIGGVSLAALLLFLKEKSLHRVSDYLLSMAGGTLLGAAFLGMLPEAIESGVCYHKLLQVVLAGIVGLFVLEKIILWRKCQDEHCERQADASAPLIIIGDAFHNMIDGVVIAAAFLSSPTLGWFVAFSVMAHEVPQELADFGILLKAGYSKKKALFYNMLSGASSLFSGLIAYFALEKMQALIPWVLSLSAASFIYIALSDLVPQMHKKTKVKDALIQLLLILVGIAIIYLLNMNHHHHH